MRRVYLYFFEDQIMFGGVKITLILCLTIVVSCVLFISYNEYTNRYSLLTTNDNSLYIFDKKSTVLNKCDGKSCSAIETKLPTKTSMNFDPGFQQSKMFESNRPMTGEVLDKVPSDKPVEAKSVEAKPASDQSRQDNNVGDSKSSTNDKSQEKEVQAPEKTEAVSESTGEKTQDNQSTQEVQPAQPTSATESEKTEEEFVE